MVFIFGKYLRFAVLIISTMIELVLIKKRVSFLLIKSLYCLTQPHGSGGSVNPDFGLTSIFDAPHI